jgi:thioredoxin-dependent peroxiredoxin
MAPKRPARKSVKSSKRKPAKKVQRKSKASAKKRPTAKRATAKRKVAPKRAAKKAPARKVAAKAPPKAPARPAASSRPTPAPGRQTTTADYRAPGASGYRPPGTGGRPLSALPGGGAKGGRMGTQSTLPFEAGAQSAPVEHPAIPKRRGGPKQGGPDWPGENLTVGMPAPDFELPSTLGRKVTLQEFRGKRVILYFYPKDDTPGCTMEACAFRDNLPRIQNKDGVVLGISLDDELSHQRFAQKYNLPFPLLADVDAAVSRQYGVYKEKNMYGRSFWGIERTTFVIDREGKVENVFRRVKVEGHADEVLATLAV